MVRSPKQRERGTGAHWLRVGCKKGTSSLLPGRACGRRRPKSRPHGSFSSRLATAAAAAALVLPRRRFAVPSSQLLRFCVCECESVCVRPSVRRVQASRDLQRAYLCDGCCSQSCCSPLTSAADHGECGRLRVQRQGLDRSWRLRRRLQGQAEKSNRLTAMFSPPTTCRSIMADPT